MLGGQRMVLMVGDPPGVWFVVGFALAGVVLIWLICGSSDLRGGV